MNPTPLKTFIVYARDDKHHKDQLLRHLRPLVQNRYLDIWHDGDILPGEDWEKLIKTNLKASQLVLVLVSVNSLNSDFIQSEELTTAVDQLKLGHTRIVPIIVAPCVWRYHNLFAGLQGLPEDMRPVVSWANTDEAWTNVVESLAGMVEEFRELEKKKRERFEQERLEAEKRRREVQEAERLERERRENEKKAQEKLAAEKQEKAQREKERVEKQKAAEAEKKQLYGIAVAAAWQSAEMENTRRAYLDFAKIYPGHPLAQEAKKRAEQMPGSRPIFKNYYLLGSGGLVTLALLLFLWVSNSNKQQGKTDVDQSSKTSPFEAEMVLVKGGTFQMGSNEYNDEKPIHSVALPDFYIGKYEVTQKQWREILGSDPPELGFPGCDQCPVESVSWDGVQQFLQKLNAKYPGYNYHLPSEAEWEYAARGGQQSKGYKYAGSNNLEEVAWYDANSGEKTHLVGRKKANELGLYDLSGNVWEWCADVWHEDYKGAPSDGSAWLKGVDQNWRVLRGGSWYVNDDYCRPAFRSWDSTTDRSDDFGLRLARHP